MAGRHSRPAQFPVLPFGPPLHEECYKADLIYFAPGLVGAELG